jgi:hypothetical protein
LLIEAIQEQQKEIEILQKVVAQHEEEIISLKKLSNTTISNSKQKSTTDISLEMSNTAILFQSSPNPFKSDTKIEYFLPAEISKASIIICDIQGIEIKQIELLTRGEGSIAIHGSEFKAGMYLYTLIANNSIIDTKRMILSEF